MTAMPCSARPVALLPFLLSWTDSDDGANDFVTGDEREFGPKGTSVSQAFERMYDDR